MGKWKSRFFVVDLFVRLKLLFQQNENFLKTHSGK